MTLGRWITLLSVMSGLVGCGEKPAESPSPPPAATADAHSHPEPATKPPTSPRSSSGKELCCIPGVDKTPSAEALPDVHTARVADAGEVVPTRIHRDPAPGAAPEGMVWVSGGRFSMGSDYEAFKDAQPIHPVEVDGFWMDRHPVTNSQYQKFVEATGYVTVAERKPTAEQYPGADPSMLVPGSIVFTPPPDKVGLGDYRQWWRYVAGANWKHPEGPGSTIVGREDHPVVQVCWDDAEAYCKWAGKRLPTEAEFEFAARGGLTQKPFAWGDRFRPEGKFMANSFQGHFPEKNTGADGWQRTSPVGTFPANGFGLHDMAGNVWQWCSDWYRPDYYAQSPSLNPQGPSDSFDPDEPGVAKRVHRGGSFLCSDQYCSRYMPGGRGKGAPDTGSSHVGFRCVLTPKRGR